MEAQLAEAKRKMQEAIARAAEIEALALEAEKRAEAHRAELFGTLNAQLEAVLKKQSANAGECSEGLENRGFVECCHVPVRRDL